MSRRRPLRLPEPTVARLPVYQRIAENWRSRGFSSIDSSQLGDQAGVTATTVRRDLAGLGSLGIRGAGYDIDTLLGHIAEALGQDRTYRIVIVGVGNLGRALANSSSFLVRGAELVGLYDADLSVIGSTVARHVVRDVHGEIDVADVAVLCVPPEAAQAVADRLVRAGIRALLNFAPRVLTVPTGVAVHYVDFSIELQILTYHLVSGMGLVGGGVMHSVGILNERPSGGDA
ncbi:MAG: redox-sensing transcriptional repressor Rex [Acidobacteria bacterium]|nr:redox-sensing transcriptional repressor Rex [Acidobacteriota bacterium]